MTGDGPATPEFAKIRLHVEADLGAGGSALLSMGQVHYLSVVRRQTVGAPVRLFNGRDGEWAGELSRLGKREGEARVLRLLRPQDRSSDLTLLFAPLKKDPMAYLIEKACELGVARIAPVLTAFTQVHHLNTERMGAHAVEAAEQSWRLSVPTIAPPAPLGAAIEGLARDQGSAGLPGRTLYFADEGGAMGGTAQAMLSALMARPAGPGAILIGPEGGFSDDERAMLRGLSFAVPVSLGPRIMRAETAAVAAITLWQAVHGDLGRDP